MKVWNGHGAKPGSRVPTIAPSALAGARRILCLHCGGRVFADHDYPTDSVLLVCSHCARTLAEVAKPPKEYQRGHLPAGRPRKSAAA